MCEQIFVWECDDGRWTAQAFTPKYRTLAAAANFGAAAVDDTVKMLRMCECVCVYVCRTARSNADDDDTPMLMTATMIAVRAYADDKRRQRRCAMIESQPAAVLDVVVRRRPAHARIVPKYDNPNSYIQILSRECVCEHQDQDSGGAVWSSPLQPGNSGRGEVKNC